MKYDKSLDTDVLRCGCDWGHWTFTSPIHKISKERFMDCPIDYWFAWIKAVAECEEVGVSRPYNWDCVAANFEKHLLGVSRLLRLIVPHLAILGCLLERKGFPRA